MAERYIVAQGQNTERFVVLDSKDDNHRICIADGRVEADAIAARLNKQPIPVPTDLVSRIGTVVQIRLKSHIGVITADCATPEAAGLLQDVVISYLRTISELHSLGHPEWLQLTSIAITEPVNG